MPFLFAISSGAHQRTVELQDDLTVGRAGHDDIQLGLEDATVSRRHARLFLRDDGWYVEDLASTNGTFCDDRRLLKAEKLTEAVRLAFGKVLFLFAEEDACVPERVEDLGATLVAVEQSDFRAMDEATRRLAVLYELARLIDSDLSVAALSERVVQVAARTLDADRAFLRLGGTAADHGLPKEEAGPRLDRLMRALMGTEPGAPLGPVGFSSPRSTGKERYQAILSPISGADTADVLVVERDEDSEPLGRDDLYFLHAVAQLAAAALRARARAERAKERISNLEGRLADHAFAGIAGSGTAFGRIKDEILKYATHPVPVTFVGEPGTGKTSLARALHLASERQGPLVEIHCRDIVAQGGGEQLLRSSWDAATGGTLLVEELVGLELPLQAFLAERLTSRPGSEDAGGDCPPRLTFTSRIGLRDALHGGNLREDLYYSLRTPVMQVPPLRERMEDLQEIVTCLVRLHAPSGSALSGRPGSAFDEEAMSMLLRHGWPGNLRELEGVVQMCVLDVRGAQRIAPAVVQRWTEGGDVLEQDAGGLVGEMATVERNFVLRALREAGGNISKAAGLLGWSRPTLYKRMREHEIDR